VDGSRDTTDAEKQFYVQTLSAVKAALPQAPAGWTLEDRNRVTPPGMVCSSSGKLPLRNSYEVRFYSQNAIAELRRIESDFSKRIAALRQLPPDKQAAFDETGRKGRDLDRQGRKLLSTDKEQAEKLIAEGRELSKAAHEIRQAHLKSIVPQIEAISKEQFEATKNIGTEVRLKIGLNGYNLKTEDGAEQIKSPGSVVALQSPKSTVLAFGAWTRQGTNYKPVYSTGSTTRVANVTVEALGNPAQADEILAGLNTTALTALIAN
jgi:hypothetical protein